MFLLDYLCEGYNKYPKNGNYIDKFLSYKEWPKKNVDADVSDISIIHYILTNPLINKNAKIKKQTPSSKKYEITDGEEIYRGETIINCMQILLQIVNYDNKEELITSKDFPGMKKGLKRSLLFDSAEEFVRECYGVGNFFAIPFKPEYSLNQAKGLWIKKRGYYTYRNIKQHECSSMIRDDNDTYFKVLYEYFQNKKAECALTERIKDKYPVWKSYRGKWKVFVSDNAFQDFVKENNVPKEIWKFSDEKSDKGLEDSLKEAISILSERRKKITSARDKSPVWKEKQSPNDDFFATFKKVKDMFLERKPAVRRRSCRVEPRRNDNFDVTENR